MSKITKTVNWTSQTGRAVTIEIELTKKMTSDISYSDGWNVDLGDKVYEEKSIKVYANGKCVDSARQNPRIIEGIFYTDEFKAKVKASGGYAKLTDKLVVNETNYNLIMVAINEAELEVAAEFKAENETIVAELEEKEAVEVAKTIANEVKWASRIVEEAEARGEVLTEVQEASWRVNYNNMNNEGGEGFIPTRATTESLSKAREILAR